MAVYERTEASDSVLAEVRDVKYRLAESLGFDVARIAADAIQREASGGRQVIRVPQERRRSVDAGTPALGYGISQNN